MGINRLTSRTQIEGMQPYQPGKPIEEVERELGITAVIKLASNENTLGPSVRVKNAVKNAVDKMQLYPDGACFYLRQALAKQLKCRPDTLMIGNGSNELLVLLGLAYLNPGDEVLTSQMSFVVYKTVAQIMGAEFIAVPMRDFAYDLEAMAKKFTPKTKMIFIANPNNPTGTLVDAKVLRNFINRIPGSCLIVLDEAYFEYVDPQWAVNTIDWVRERKNLVVLRTFSKAYGLAGLRIGYGVAAPGVTQTIERVRDPFNVNSLAQVAAIAALGDQAYMKKCVALAKSERKRVAKELRQMGFKVVAGQTNFLFTKLNPTDSKDLVDTLMQRGIIVRPFPEGYARITLGKVAENNKMLRALKKSVG